MSELKMRIQKWLIELYKYKNKLPKDNRRILVRYIEGKIETLENVLEMIEEIENDGKGT